LDFFEEYSDVSFSEDGRRKAVEKIKANVAWVSQNRDDIAAWLYNNIDMSQ